MTAHIVSHLNRFDRMSDPEYLEEMVPRITRRMQQHYGQRTDGQLWTRTLELSESWRVDWLPLVLRADRVIDAGVDLRIESARRGRGPVVFYGLGKRIPQGSGVIRAGKRIK